MDRHASVVPEDMTYLFLLRVLAKQEEAIEDTAALSKTWCRHWMFESHPGYMLLGSQ